MKYTRIDKNFILNASAINTVVQDYRDQLLMMRLTGMVAFAFQTPRLNEDVFGNKILTAAEVGDMFDYNKNYLNTHHPSPTQLQGKSTEDIERIKLLDDYAGKLKLEGEPRWYSVLDNALYNLYYTEIPYTQFRQRRTANGLENVSDVKGLKLFYELRKIYVNQTRKTCYEYKEHPTFIKNTASYFLFTKWDLFRKLNLTELIAYFDLIYMRAIERYNAQQISKLIKHPDVTVTNQTIDYIAKKWDIQKVDGSEGKSKFSLERNAINKTIDSINEKNGSIFCEVRWVKARATDRFTGQPLFVFPFPEEEKSVMENEFVERLDLYTLYMLKERFRVFARRDFLSIEDFNKQFISYLYQEGIDVDGKTATAQEAYQMVARRTMDGMHVAKIPTHIKIYIDKLSR